MAKRIINDADLRKYKINECLLKLSINEHREAVRLVPKEIKISLNTFHNYRNILLNDPQDIPHEKVVRLERFFGLRQGDLLNRNIKANALKDLLSGVRRYNS